MDSVEKTSITYLRKLLLNELDSEENTFLPDTTKQISKQQYKSALQTLWRNWRIILLYEEDPIRASDPLEDQMLGLKSEIEGFIIVA